MAEIQTFVLVDRVGEAKDMAQNEGNVAIIARTYEYTDSELVWTLDGSDTWPPEEGR